MILATGCGTDSAQRVAVLEHTVGQDNLASAILGQKFETIELVATATCAAPADPNLGLPAAKELSENQVSGPRIQGRFHFAFSVNGIYLLLKTEVMIIYTCIYLF